MKTLITRLKNGAECLRNFHGKFASSKEARNWRHLAALAVLAAIIISFAQNNTSNETTETIDETTETATPKVQLVAPSKSRARYFRVFPYSHKQEFTTTREITVEQREGGDATYPVGTKIRILFSYEKKNYEGKGRSIADRINGGPISPLVTHKILIGETQEQILIPTEAIAELGGTPGEPIETMSLQPPEKLTLARTDAPKGFIWSGSPTGDENVPSSDPAGEQVVFQKLNALRKSKGIHPLKWDEDLARAARYQAGDLYANGGSYIRAHYINDIVIDIEKTKNRKIPPGITESELGPVGSYFLVEPDIVAALRFCPTAKGSNWVGTSHGGSNPSRYYKGAYERWRDSPGHCRNMLASAYNKVGIGNVGDEWVMFLGD